mgnify:CR=1 FL=1|jgi:hypothetical protein|tara:strand:- start:300 stop:743 length:444 start_codon:yes stop_codon:yes gene_type:complete
MFRTIVFAIILLTASFTGCTDSLPNRTIVTLQVDADGEDLWIYLYTVPRTKMDNFTISTSFSDDTVSSVYSHQKKISFDNLTKDADDYAFFTFQVDLSDVYWELICKIRFSSDSSDAKTVLEVVILSEDDEESEEWKLPYSTPLNYK